MLRRSSVFRSGLQNSPVFISWRFYLYFWGFSILLEDMTCSWDGALWHWKLLGELWHLIVSCTDSRYLLLDVEKQIQNITIPCFIVASFLFVNIVLMCFGNKPQFHLICGKDIFPLGHVNVHFRKSSLLYVYVFCEVLHEAHQCFKTEQWWE